MPRMKVMALSLLLQLSEHNLVALGNAIPPLTGAAPTAGSGAPRAREHFQEAAVLATGDIAYSYGLRVVASLPLELDQDGDPQLDSCVEFLPDANDSNFTWYGLQIQLPDDADLNGGASWVTDVTRATESLGFVQDYNTSQRLIEYNFTSKESQPLVKLHFNDEPVWDTYHYDFVEQGAAVADGADYQEFHAYGTVACYATPANETSRRVLFPVKPTLTISLEKFGGGGDNVPPAPTPAPIAAASLSRGVTTLGLSLSFFAALMSGFPAF